MRLCVHCSRRHFTLQTKLNVNTSLVRVRSGSGSFGKSMEFFFSISRPGKSMEIWGNLKSFGKRLILQKSFGKKGRSTALGREGIGRSRREKIGRPPRQQKKKTSTGQWGGKKIDRCRCGRGKTSDWTYVCLFLEFGGGGTDDLSPRFVTPRSKRKKDIGQWPRKKDRRSR